MSEGKAVIIKADMPKEMQEDAVDCATQAMGKSTDDGVCQYTEVLFLVGCEMPNVDTLPFFRRLLGIYKVNSTRSTIDVGIAL